jgi:hypothetical protein
MGAARLRPIVFDAAGLAPDAATVDLLARLQLAARRAGVELLLRRPSADLVALLAFAGLADALRVEPGREAEEREERAGLEEERELPDQPAFELDDL